VIKELMSQVQANKLTYRKDVLVGIEEASNGLQRLLLGKNDGKVLIKLAWPNDEKPKPKL